MAYTSIISVHRLDRSIDYITDREKTSRKSQGAGSLEEAIGYALNRDKTEQIIFEDSIGCTCEHAYEDMCQTKKRFHKMDGVQGYHLIQSFAAGELTPELAHLIGVELAEELLKGKYEVVITTHLNTDHYHNHLVFNSVSMADGKKYHSNSQSYYEEVRRISDDLCRKYGLSIIQPERKGKPYPEWLAEKNGRPTWRTAIRMDIREAVQESFTWRQFLSRMEQRGYTWKLNQKYISLKAPGMERYIRLKSLGENYSELAIREWILQPKQRQSDQEKHRLEEPKRKKLRGLQALYYSYLYQMGVLKRKPRRTSYLVRQDIRRLDERIAQMDFLQKHGITTREELQEYQKPKEERMLSLIRERRALYRREESSDRISEIGCEIKQLRQEIRMCMKIYQTSIEIEKKMEEQKSRNRQMEKEKEQPETGPEKEWR